MRTHPDRALALLAHPLPWLALILVALNDFVLRPLLPSWWTGKLSDLGVLFFLPLCLTALLSLVWPWKSRSGPGLIAFGAVLALFLLLKVSPESNRWITAWLPVRAVPDPSDLLALPAWLGALLLWRGTFSDAKAPAAPPRKAWLLLLPLAALVTLADAAAPEYGVACVQTQAQGLLAETSFTAYASADGGQTWQTSDLPDQRNCQPGESGRQVDFSSRQGARYRLTTGEKVEYSADGRTWETVYASHPIGEAEDAYLHKTLPSNIYYRPGPLSAVVDARSGSLVAAMGLEGILIVSPDGGTAWVGVGSFRHAVLRADGLAGYATLLFGEFLLATAGALTWLATAALRLRRVPWQVVLTVFGWIFLAAAGFALTPSLANSSYTAPFSMLALLLALLWSLGLVITAAVRLRRGGLRPFLRRAVLLPLAGLLLFLPYAGWALGLLPFYWIAQLAAASLIITIAAVLG